MTQSTDSTGQQKDFRSPFILALDVGTSSTRAMLFDASGSSVPAMVSQCTYELTTSNEGEVSVDADMLVGVVAQTIDELLKKAGSMAEQIGAVATDTFWHSLIGVDTDGRPIMPLMTWEDTRPYESTSQLRKKLDEKAVHDRTGARFHASYWPAKLYWLANTSPDIFAKAAQWLSFGEYLHRTFLGHSVCSLSMASGTGMLVTRNRVWDDELLRVLKVKPEQMPRLGDLHDSSQGLIAEYAERWPALRNVPWFPAVGDGASACVGSGCASVENWSLTMGTSSAIRVVVAPERVVPSLGLWLYLIDGKRAVLGGALSEGGNLFSWLDNVMKLPSLSEAEPQAAEIAPDGHGLTILPFIAGERSLGWHAEARMTVAGISLHTSPADLLRAGAESLAYRLDAVYERLCALLEMEREVPKVICSGGALLSSSLLQSILADTLGASLYPSHEHEASARGAALLALETMGVIEDVARIQPDLSHVVVPNAERGAIYKKALERQEKLYHLLLSE